MYVSYLIPGVLMVVAVTSVKRIFSSAGGSSPLARHSAFSWETASISVNPLGVLFLLGRRINRSSGPEAQGETQGSAL